MILEWTSLVAWMVKNLPAVQEIRVQSLDREGPLEKGMATHSSIIAWRISWTEEPGELQSMELQRIGYDWVTWLHFISLHFTSVSQLWFLFPLSKALKIFLFSISFPWEQLGLSQRVRHGQVTFTFTHFRTV